MLWISRLFCRVGQTGFYLAMPLLPYKDPEVLHHMGQIPLALQTAGVHSVLLVTDSFLYRSGTADLLLSALTVQGVRCAVYDRTCPNPTVKNVEEARRLYLE